MTASIPTGSSPVYPRWQWFLWLAVFFLHVLFYEVTWFSIDQARDLLQAADIASGRQFPLSGPLMHWIAHVGPLYYYFLALPLLFFSHPDAVYFFLAVVATLTVAGGHWLISRYFNRRAAHLFVALFAPSAFVLMDSRALWTPAFLPFMTLLAVLSMALFFWEKKDLGLVILALVVGIGSQFHLSFILVLPVFLAAWACYRRRVKWTTLLWGVLAGLLTYAPYLYYQAAHDWEDIRAFFHFAGQGSSNAAELSASYATRLLNYLLVPVYLAGPWLRLPGLWLRLFQWSAYLFTLLLVSSLVYFAVQLFRGARTRALHSDRRALLVGFYLGILLMLLGRSVDLYYYYFDLLYPVPFFLTALFLEEVWRRWISPHARFPFRAVISALLIAFILVQGGSFFYWVLRHRQEGLFRLPLRMLDLNRMQREDTAPQETFMTLKAKKEIARLVTRSWGWSRSDAYSGLLGSRFYDSTEDRGYWLQFYDQAGSTSAAGKPMVLWHRSDPLEKWAGRLNLKARMLGPFRIAAADPSILPATWQTAFNPSLSLPIRTVPKLREYGFVPPTRWETEPVILNGAFSLSQKPTLCLMVVITKGERPRPSLEVNSRPVTMVEQNQTLMTSEFYYELSGALKMNENTMVLSLSGQRNFDLEVFGWAR